MRLQRASWWYGLAGAAAAYVVVHALRRRREAGVREEEAMRADDELVDMTSEDSFPASDPPSWTATHNS
jgi:hypothetical protein